MYKNSVTSHSNFYTCWNNRRLILRLGVFPIELHQNRVSTTIKELSEKQTHTIKLFQPVGLKNVF